jgi:hypothetical protein
MTARLTLTSHRVKVLLSFACGVVPALFGASYSGMGAYLSGLALFESRPIDYLFVALFAWSTIGTIGIVAYCWAWWRYRIQESRGSMALRATMVAGILAALPVAAMFGAAIREQLRALPLFCAWSSSIAIAIALAVREWRLRSE